VNFGGSSAPCGYDAIVDTQGLLKSALIARAAKQASWIWTLATAAREPLAARFYSMSRTTLPLSHTRRDAQPWPWVPQTLGCDRVEEPIDTVHSLGIRLTRPAQPYAPWLLHPGPGCEPSPRAAQQCTRGA